MVLMHPAALLLHTFISFLLFSMLSAILINDIGQSSIIHYSINSSLNIFI